MRFRFHLVIAGTLCFGLGYILGWNAALRPENLAKKHEWV